MNRERYLLGRALTRAMDPRRGRGGSGVPQAMRRHPELVRVAEAAGLDAFALSLEYIHVMDRADWMAPSDPFAEPVHPMFVYAGPRVRPGDLGSSDRLP